MLKILGTLIVANFVLSIFNFAQAEYIIFKGVLTHDDNTTEQVLVYSGEFEPGTSDQMRIALELNPGYRKLVMHSPGGTAYEAYNTGQVLSDYNVKVWIPKGRICLSACATAFLGGRDYQIDGQLGFHSSYIPESEWAGLVEKGLLSDIYKSAQAYGFREAYYLQLHGFSLVMGSDILSNTSESEFLVFDNTEDLMAYYVRTDDYPSKNLLLNYYKDIDREIDIRGSEKMTEVLIKELNELKANPIYNFKFEAIVYDGRIINESPTAPAR